MALFTGTPVPSEGQGAWEKQLRVFCVCTQSCTLVYTHLPVREEHVLAGFLVNLPGVCQADLDVKVESYVVLLKGMASRCCLLIVRAGLGGLPGEPARGLPS